MEFPNYRPINFLLNQQIVRFGIIGCIGAFINMLIVVFMVEHMHWHPLGANIIGFLGSFNISYFGHRYYSFSDQVSNNHTTSITRFLFIALSSFGLNELLFYLFLTYCHFHYTLSLIFVIAVVATINFILNKFWAFN